MDFSVFRTRFIYRARQIELGYLPKKTATADHYLWYKWGFRELDWILGLDKVVFARVGLESLFPGYQRLLIYMTRFPVSVKSLECFFLVNSRVVRGFGLRAKKRRPMADTEESRCTREKKPLVPRVESSLSEVKHIT